MKEILRITYAPPVSVSKREREGCHDRHRLCEGVPIDSFVGGAFTTNVECRRSHPLLPGYRGAAATPTLGRNVTSVTRHDDYRPRLSPSFGPKERRDLAKNSRCNFMPGRRETHTWNGGRDCPRDRAGSFWTRLTHQPEFHRSRSVSRRFVPRENSIPRQSFFCSRSPLPLTRCFLALTRSSTIRENEYECFWWSFEDFENFQFEIGYSIS